MTKILFLIIILVSGCCQRLLETKPKAASLNLDLNTNLPRIENIDSLENVYVISASKGTIGLKIISPKTDDFVTNRIQIGRRYDLDLYSILKEVYINGTKVLIFDNVDCIGIGDSSRLCIDRKNSVFDIYRARNLQGLNYIKVVRN